MRETESKERLGHLMAVQRLRTESVMYTGRVSVDSDVKAPSDLLLERLLVSGDCKTAGEKQTKKVRAQ